jgi:hypothetical protein
MLVGALAILRPSFGEAVFLAAESLVRRLARRPWRAAAVLAGLVLVPRLILLPLWPIPKPVIYDEFCYIVQGDTFAHGRLANSPHPISRFFESPYLLQHPTYASKYPPAQGLALGAGQVIFGDPWFGTWFSCGLMMAALVWSISAWLPSRWAFLGGVLALPLAIESYWMNSYWGGAVAATGGALLLGGAGRLIRRSGAKAWPQIRNGLAMAAGIAILANSRPYEGLVFAIPIAIAFLFSRPRWIAITAVFALLIPAGAATAYYNYRVTGSALVMPFVEYARQYVYIPLFTFQPLNPSKACRTPVMDDLHQNWERRQWETARSLKFFPTRLDDFRKVCSTLLGSVVLAVPILAFLPALFRDRRIRLPLTCAMVALAGSAIEVCYYTHYAAPATAAIFILLVQAFRHLRVRNPAGRFLSRAVPLVVLAAAAISQAIVLVRQEPPENSQPPNARREQVASSLDDRPGRHVILVRYTGSQSPHEEWVYNSADIDSQDVIWAHDLGTTDNAAILAYYRDRHFWSFQPDSNSIRLEPYAPGN